PAWTQLARRRLRRQLDYLRRHYAVLPLIEIVGRLRAGRPLPARAAAVTFDDGYRNNYTCAWPVLRELGIPATIFVSTGFIDRGEALWPDRLTLALHATPERRVDFMGRTHSLASGAARARARAVIADELKTQPRAAKDRLLEDLFERLGPTPPTPVDFLPLRWDEVRAMHASGQVDIGAHTVGHEILSQLDVAEQRWQIEESCRRVAAEIDAPCRLFAYPNGRPSDFDGCSQEILAGNGVIGAVTTCEGLVRAGDDPLALPRILVGANVERDQFAVLASGLSTRWARLRASWRRPAGVLDAVGSGVG
ncbi:MAG: polysaccharide deacetylase family protein, partial [Candidatus Binatia bacterium]